MLTSPSPPGPRRVRSSSTGGRSRNLSWTAVPPAKSIPRLKPYVAMAHAATPIDRHEKPMKNHFVPYMSLKRVFVKTCSMETSDAQPLHPRPQGQKGVEQRARHEDGGEQVRQDADGERQREASHRAGPFRVQEEGGAER